MNKGRVDIPPIVKDYKEMGNGSYRVFNVSGSDIKYVQFRDYTKDVLNQGSANFTFFEKT